MNGGLSMKKFLNLVMEWKTGASFMFTGSVLVYTIVTLILGYKTIDVTSILSILLISSVGTFIQFLAFTDHIIKNLRYSIRIIIFVIPFMALLTCCAFLFRWFPTEVSGAWLLFIAIFLTVFTSMTVGFEIYFRITGRKYDGLLGQYKKQKEAQKND